MGNNNTKNKSNKKNKNNKNNDLNNIIKKNDADRCKKKNYLKDFINDNNQIPIIDRLNNLFGKGFRCNKCLSLLLLKIKDSKNERGELLIEGKCSNNHIAIKTIKEILKTKGLIKFIDKFKIVDNFHNNRKEYFYYKHFANLFFTYNDPFLRQNYDIKYLTDEEENYYYSYSLYKKKVKKKKIFIYVMNVK